MKLTDHVYSVTLFEYHTLLSETFLKVPDSARAMKSELIVVNDPTAWLGDVWGYRR